MADQPTQSNETMPSPAQTVQTPPSPPAAVPMAVVDRIHLMVRNRQKILFDEDVKAVTATNDTGLFDVLPEHTNFISVITKSVVAHKMDGTKYEIPLANGIMKIKDSGVRCYIDLLTTAPLPTPV